MINPKILAGVLVSLGSVMLVGASSYNSIHTAEPTQQNQQVEEISDKELEVSQPIIEEKNESEIIDIPYETIQQNDPTLEKGKQTTTQAGVNGKKKIKYMVHRFHNVIKRHLELRFRGGEVAAQAPGPAAGSRIKNQKQGHSLRWVLEPVIRR